MREGSHTVDINGQTGSFAFVPPPPSLWRPLPMSPVYIAGTIIVAISVGAIVFTLMRKRLY
jgi:hypothetical protein